MTAMGQTIVIINDPRLAFELLEKRAAIHSSRPKQVFAGEMYVARPWSSWAFGGFGHQMIATS